MIWTRFLMMSNSRIALGVNAIYLLIMQIQENLVHLRFSYNTKKALVTGLILAIITAVVYLSVVVVTSPDLPPVVAINAALEVNGTIIIGLAIGIGIQGFASSYRKGLECRADDNKKRKYDKEQQQQQQNDNGIRRIFNIGGHTGSSGASTVMSSFLSFFSLVPLGCCGNLFFLLSILPSIFGGTLSVILIQYSVLLSYIGLVVVIGFAALSVTTLRKELKARACVQQQ